MIPISVLKSTLIVVLSMIPVYAAAEMTQLDVIAPPGLLLHDSLSRISTTVSFPGLFLDTSNFKAVTGFVNKRESSTDYSGHPRTYYDDQQDLIMKMVPYVAAQKSFSTFSSGVYFGDVSVDSRNHNAVSAADSIQTFDKSRIKLNGAVWIAPKIRFLKGLSFWVEGDHQIRDTHFANIDSWKRINSKFEFERKYGSGLLSGTFSFCNNHYSFLRFGYGKDNVHAEEQQSDTLFFSNDSYYTSAEKIDNSFKIYNVTAEIGHMVKIDGCNFGIFIGGDRTNIDYGNSERDTSRFYMNTYVFKGITLKKVSLYTGLNFTYSGTLFNESNHELGYMHLAREYTVGRMSHYIDVKAPLFGVLSIGETFKLMSGIDFAYDLKKTNYDFTTGTKNKAAFSSINCLLYPLNIQYNPTPNTSLSISPKFDNEIFIGSIEIRYGI